MLHNLTLTNDVSRNEQGFTLVELLVVIGIIAIITAIAVPVFLNQRKKAADAAVMSDLKTSALAVLSSELTSAEAFALYGKHGINAWGKDGRHALSAPVDWNSKVPEVPKMNLSEGTVMAIWMYVNNTGDWDAHAEGDFCLGAVNHKSTYNYLPGAGGGAVNYDKYLYYDVKLGGVKTMSELVDAMNANAEISCTGATKQYMAARGL